MTAQMVALGGGGAVVECGDVPTGGLAALTVEGWVRVAAVSLANRPLLTKYRTGAPPGVASEWALYVTRDGRVYFVVFSAAGANVAYSAAGRIEPNRLNHVAGCYDSAPEGAKHCRVWLNGQDVTAGSRIAGGTVSDTGEPVRIGGYLGEEGIGFAGRVGWQRISDVCRYPGGLAGPEFPPSVDGHTVGQWNMTEGAGGTVDNAQGNAALDGMIVGGSWVASESSDKRKALPVLSGVFGRSYALPAGARG